ncbi:MAG: four helix bundle suffix domain-containing protein [Bacteroidales bacterium]|nr:four helix bundle suffix domain-containing protein [Bacteroidales bacterium]
MESTAQYNNQGIFKQVPNYRKLYFYMKADTLVLLTDIFCKRFLSQHGDRTVDQMNQAARSGKQNIVEGCEAALTSSETEIKLVNVGRSSFQELREDYEDYLKKHGLPIWDKEHPRYEKMVEFCRKNNAFEDYKDLANSIDAEAFCNMAKSLCHITDRMFYSYLKKLEDEFLKYGGIRERMHAARTSYRQGIDERLQQLEAENANLKAENERLRKALEARSTR